MNRLLPLMQFLSSKPWETSIQGFVESHCVEFAESDSHTTQSKHTRVKEFDHSQFQVWKDYCDWVEYILKPMMEESGIRDIEELSDVCGTQLKSGKISAIQHKTIRHFVNHYVSTLVDFDAFVDMMTVTHSRLYPAQDLEVEYLDETEGVGNWDGTQNDQVGEKEGGEEAWSGEQNDQQAWGAEDSNQEAWTADAEQGWGTEENDQQAWDADDEYQQAWTNDAEHETWGTQDRNNKESQDHSWMKEWDLKVVIATSLIEAEDKCEISERDMKLLPWAKAITNLQYFVQQALRDKKSDETDEEYAHDMAYNEDLREQWIVALNDEQRKVESLVIAKLAGEEETPRKPKFNTSSKQYWQESKGTEKEPRNPVDIALEECSEVQSRVSAQRTKLRRNATRASISHELTEELYLLVREAMEGGAQHLDLQESKAAKRIFAKLPVKQGHLVQDFVDLIVLEDSLKERKSAVTRVLTEQEESVKQSETAAEATASANQQDWYDYENETTKEKAVDTADEYNYDYSGYDEYGNFDYGEDYNYGADEYNFGTQDSQAYNYAEPESQEGTTAYDYSYTNNATHDEYNYEGWSQPAPDQSESKGYADDDSDATDEEDFDAEKHGSYGNESKVQSAIY